MANSRFSRTDHYDADRRYVGVRLQQGVPLLDTDWNEQEDMLRDQLRSLTRHALGDGVNHEDSFRIEATTPTSDGFRIKGFGGGAEGGARAYVDGFEVWLGQTVRYSQQAAELDARVEAANEEMMPVVIPALPDPPAAGDAFHTIYLEVWERNEYPGDAPVQGAAATPLWEYMVLEELGLESCTRLKREFAVKIVAGEDLPAMPAGHRAMKLARLRRSAGRNEVVDADLTDLRRVGLSLASVLDEIIEARGTRESLDNRMSVALRANGELRTNSVGSVQIQDDAVLRRHLVQGAVGRNEIADGEVREQNIGRNQVLGRHIHPNQVTDGHLASSTLTARVLDDDAIQSRHIGDAQVGTEHLKNDLIRTQHLQNGCVGNDAINKHSLRVDRLELGSSQAGEYRMWWSSEDRGKEMGVWVPFSVPFAYIPRVDHNYRSGSKNVDSVRLITVNESGFLLRVALNEKGNNGTELHLLEGLMTSLTVLRDQALTEFVAFDFDSTDKEIVDVEKKVGEVEVLLKETKPGRYEAGKVSSKIAYSESVTARRANTPYKAVPSKGSRSRSMSSSRVRLAARVDRLREKVNSVRRELVRNVDAGDSYLALDWTARLGAGLSPGFVLGLLDRKSTEAVVSHVPAASRHDFMNQIGAEIAKEMKRAPGNDPVVQLKAVEAQVPDLVDRAARKAVESYELKIPVALKQSLVKV